MKVYFVFFIFLSAIFNVINLTAGYNDSTAGRFADCQAVVAAAIARQKSYDEIAARPENFPSKSSMSDIEAAVESPARYSSPYFPNRDHDVSPPSPVKKQ